ncbi:hypoxanthine phosphoribosyltransferase [Thermocoleostomius sinensis]|uniref:Hypoxanthine phosphoribosyltransferase n=1 Tax=Thermocoleostomius sinensis A174 TaxID=2016057 RepID=A0A9E8ZCV0_9CYAN|nr:hypoxanthine phosphoribosyltransferase [Thermocoleostomius sinensis]WAL59063.1 hypoxanthine phosphoribosyltransferase [Thermocoleostomius sinensis A174]
MEKPLELLIAQTAIANTVQRLAQEIDRDYVDRSPLMIGILKGSFIFLADLVRAMQIPIRDVEFMRFSSYGSSTTSSGQAQMLMGIAAETIVNQDVIVVEDIIDTGITTHTALELLQQYQPASLKLCALLNKPERRQRSVQIDYLGFTIPDRFIVGYGIDFNQQYRQLPAIYGLTE